MSTSFTTLARAGEACLLGLAIATFTAVPTALRTASAGASFGEGLLLGAGILVPVLALSLGLARAAGRGFRGITGVESPRSLALGAALWLGIALPLFAAIGAVLKDGTNHRGLGGATFGALAAIVAIVALLVVNRLLSFARGLVSRGVRTWIVAAPGIVLGVVPILLVAGTLAPSPDPNGAPVRAAILDGAIALIATALGASLDFPAWLTRVARAAGVPLAAMVLLGGLLRVESSPDLARALRQGGGLPASLLVALQEWTDRDGDGHGSHFGGDDCDEGDPLRHVCVTAEPPVVAAATPAPPTSAGVPTQVAPSSATQVGASAATQVGSAPTPVAAPVPAPPKHPDIVFVTLDTVRADHTSVYGYDRETTPQLAALAARGAVFEHAYAVASDTQRAITPLVSGKRLSQTPHDTREWPTILDEVETLAERLEASGYATAAVTSFTWMSEERGFAQGFRRFSSVYEAAHPERGVTGSFAVDAVKKILDADLRPGAPLFLWVHLFDAHGRYMEQPEHRFGGRLVDKYDGEIAFVDARLGDIVAAVEARRGRDHVAWIVHGSHGEAFSEHGFDGHGSELYEEVLRVPLVVSLPDAAPSRFSERAVSTIDLAPTVLALAGAKSDDLPGFSLLPAVRGEPFTREAVYAHAHRRTAVIDWPLKLIRFKRTKKDRLLLFDLSADPQEKADISAARGDDLTRLVRTLDGFEGT